MMTHGIAEQLSTAEKDVSNILGVSAAPSLPLQAGGLLTSLRPPKEKGEEQPWRCCYYILTDYSALMVLLVETVVPSLLTVGMSPLH